MNTTQQHRNDAGNLEAHLLLHLLPCLLSLAAGRMHEPKRLLATQQSDRVIECLVGVCQIIKTQIYSKTTDCVLQRAKTSSEACLASIPRPLAHSGSPSAIWLSCDSASLRRTRASCPAVALQWKLMDGQEHVVSGRMTARYSCLWLL